MEPFEPRDRRHTQRGKARQSGQNRDIGQTLDEDADIRAILEPLRTESPEQRLNQLLYLIPILGAGPAAFLLFSGKGSPTAQRTYRTAVWMALIWLLSYGLVAAGGSGLEGPDQVPTLVTNSLITSSYFIASVVLMVKTWRDSAK